MTMTTTATRTPNLRRRLVWGVSAAAAVVALVMALTGSGVRAQEPAAAPPAAAPQAASPQKETVRIVFKVFPPSRATVSWGKKKLGAMKPKESLSVVRPRDSGPMDVVVRAEGCLPVHTRAYTFTDSVVSVKVTPLEQKNTLFGYKEVPPEDGGTGGPDGGMP